MYSTVFFKSKLAGCKVIKHCVIYHKSNFLLLMFEQTPAA